MSLSHILAFLFILTTVLGVGHYYLWHRLVKDSELSPSLHRTLTVTIIVLLVSQPLTMILGRQLPREWTAPMAFLAFGWLGLLSTYFSLLFSVEPGRFFLALRRKWTARTRGDETVPSPQKRTTLRRMFAGGVALGGTALTGVGVSRALDGFSVVSVDIQLNKLPRAFDGFRIVQLSDIHVGPTIGRDFVERMVAVANDLSPDLVAITGDLVDGSVENLSHHTAPLRDLKARHGSYFVTGNHEYYSGVEDWLEELQRLGVQVLRNRSVRIGDTQDSFVLAGVTDHRAGDYGDAPDLAFALRDRKPEEEVVLLAHQPREIDEATKHDVGLQLSGHTHGGQFWPWNWAVYLVQPVVKGLAKFGRTQIYVNTGTGYWGPPMRVGTDSEITVVTLRSA